jgi:hypothetical protein
MKRRTLAAIAFATLPVVAAEKKAAPAPPPPVEPGVRVTRGADGVRTDIALDGPLWGWALPKGAEGRRTLYVLAGPPGKTPRAADCGVDAGSTDLPRHGRLLRWKPGGDTLETLPGAWPDGRLEAADWNGDGAEDLVLVRDGAIEEVPLEGAKGEAPVVLARDPAIAGSREDPRVVRSPADAADARLRLTLPGELLTFDRAAAGGLAAASAVELPIRVRSGAGRTVVDTPSVHALGALADVGPVFATDPEPVGSLRVRTTLVTPDARPERPAVECWLRLPSAERVLDGAFAVMDGKPVWIATTMSAERLDVFGEKALRIFPLGGDRTRVGEMPRSSAATGLNIWQTAHPVVIDLDRDGRDDLVLAYWKGLRRTIAALEIHRGEPDGKLAKRRDVELTVEDADQGFISFGHDADGDRLPDLVVLTETAVLVYPGSGERPAERPIVEKPSRRVPLPSERPNAGETSVGVGLGGGFTTWRRAAGFGTPRPIDLDGDGQIELVFVGDVDGLGRASVVTFRSGLASSNSAR